MPYNFLNAGLSITGKTPKQVFRSDYQELVNEQFEEGWNWFDAQIETSTGSGEFTEIVVRVESMVYTATGKNKGDDFKRILFKDIDYNIDIGRFFIFDDDPNNYWMVVKTLKDNSLKSSAELRRCNNTLRWIDSDGGKYSVPCIMDYSIKENRDYATAGSKFVLSSGLLFIATQFNETTNKIRENQRFLFGNEDNWHAYRVQGGGIQNYDNRSTFVNSNSGYIDLTMNAGQVNYDTDDLVNGIADVGQYVYTISLSNPSVEGEVGETISLTATVFLNGETVERDITWVSDDTDIATVDASGNISFVALGSCSITASLANNSSVSDSTTVNVVASASQYQIVVDPNVNYILQNENNAQNFSVDMYLNGVLTAEAFTFNLVSGSVPAENYEFNVVDGNNFSIKNIERYSSDNLIVQCNNANASQDIEIELRGVF